jgi:hypothetical protein
MLRKLLRFDHMHENKILFFCFLRREIDLKVLKLEMFWRKLGILIPDQYLTM